MTDKEKITLLEQEVSALKKEIEEKDKFFSIIAHDLRGPFNGLLGFSEMMVSDLALLSEENISQKDIQEIKKMASMIKNSSDNLFILLENLLEWSRMRQGMIPYNPEMIILLLNLKKIVETIIESASKKNITIKYEIPFEFQVITDVHMFGSVIRNLFSNAVKFTQKNGQINISAKLIENFVEISFRDSGIGMSLEMLSKLFQLGQNNGRKGTDGEPTTGLGLVICKDFIEKHGGKLWVESEEGKGSIFHFTLPKG